MGNNKITLKHDDVVKLFLDKGLKVLEPYVNTRTRIKAQCLKCGIIVQPFYKQIWSGQSGCRTCASDKFRLTKKQLDELFNKFDLEIIDKYINSIKPVQFRCKHCGSFSKIAVKALRQKKNYWCSECDNSPIKSRIQRKPHSRKVDKEYIEQQFMKHGFELRGRYERKSKAVSVKHLRCQTISDMTLKSIENGKGFCTGCVKNKPLTHDEANSVILKAGLEPLEKYKGVDFPIKCKCMKCERVLSPTIHTLRTKKSGCAYCHKVKIDPIEAENFMLQNGYKPLEPYKNSKTKWKCEHLACGKICFPLYNSIKNGQGGCTNCAVGKFDFNEVSYFYVMHNEILRSFKIGISNSNAKTDRMLTHSKNDWNPKYKYEFENGYLAYDFEQSMLSYIRTKLGIPIHLEASLMPSGFSETMSEDLIKYEQLIELVKLNHAGDIDLHSKLSK